MAVDYILKTNKKAETFQQKADLLNLSLDEQVELLNKLYDKKLRFQVSKLLDGTSITIDILDKTIEVLELPEVESINFKWIFTKIRGRHKVDVIKFPKCMPPTPARELNLSMYNRVFAWDDNITNIQDFYDRESFGVLEMIIMKYTDGRKPKIYRFKK